MYKHLYILLIAAMLLAGCAQEAYYVDQEWGKAQMASWDMQIAHPDHKYAGQNPDGMEGIHAEEVMDVYNRSFAEKSTETGVFQLGLTTNNSGN